MLSWTQMSCLCQVGDYEFLFYLLHHIHVYSTPTTLGQPHTYINLHLLTLTQVVRLPRGTLANSRWQCGGSRLYMYTLP
jgi:hypothetical protein